MTTTCEHIEKLLEYLKLTKLKIFYEVHCPECNKLYFFPEKEEL
jgi:phage FluMu protein Com